MTTELDELEIRIKMMDDLRDMITGDDEVIISKGLLRELLIICRAEFKTQDPGGCNNCTYEEECKPYHKKVGL